MGINSHLHINFILAEWICYSIPLGIARSARLKSLFLNLIEDGTVRRITALFSCYDDEPGTKSGISGGLNERLIGVVSSVF